MGSKHHNRHADEDMILVPRADWETMQRILRVAHEPIRTLVEMSQRITAAA